MNPSVHLVEAAPGYHGRRDYDAYPALLSPDVRVGIAVVYEFRLARSPSPAPLLICPLCTTENH